MFFRQMVAVFLVRTRPDSSMAKPAAMNMTSTPCTRNENVLNTKAVSSLTSAMAIDGAKAIAADIAAPPSNQLRIINTPCRSFSESLGFLKVGG